MISVSKARKIGINACIDRIGREICKNHADNSTSAYGRNGDVVSCFVGVNDEPAPQINLDEVSTLVLSDLKGWKYAAACDVSLQDGSVHFTTLL